MHQVLKKQYDQIIGNEGENIKKFRLVDNFEEKKIQMKLKKIMSFNV